MSSMSEESCEIRDKGDDFTPSTEQLQRNRTKQELSDELQKATQYFREARETLSREMEEWQREKDECLRREQEVALQYERCRKQMQTVLDGHQLAETAEADRRRGTFDDIFGRIRLADGASDDSEDDPAENTTDTEGNEEVEVGLIEEEPEEAEEEVLEYSPVESAVEIQNAGVLEGRKRRASSPLTDEEDAKRRKLVLVECPVCLETLSEIQKFGKILVAPTCGHVMCSNCAMRVWLLRKNPCTGCQKKTACCPKCHRKYNIQKVKPVYL